MRVGVSLFVSVWVGFAGPSSSGLPRPTLCGSYWLLFSGVWSPGGQIQDPRGPWGQYCLSGGQCRVLKILGLLPAHWWVMPVPGVSARLLAGRSVPGVWRQGPGISELVSDYLCVCGGFFTQLGVGSGQNAWWAAVHGAAKSQTRLNDFTFTFHFHALEKEMSTHSSVLAWRTPGTEGFCLWGHTESDTTDTTQQQQQQLQGRLSRTSRKLWLRHLQNYCFFPGVHLVSWFLLYDISCGRSFQAFSSMVILQIVVILVFS